MTRRVILHIGPAKTGTSSLQEALFAARTQLQAQGYIYPTFGRHRLMPKLPGHHGIPALVRRTGEVPQDFLDGLSGLDPDLTLILSSEDFSLMDEAAISAFMAALGPARVEPVYYARRWDHLLPSVWQELVKHGHSWPYLEFLSGQVTSPRASHYLNFAIPVGRWAGFAGKSSLRLFSYDNVVAAGQDIVGHFGSEVLGVPLEQVAPRQANPRWPAERVEVLRLLNGLVFGRRKPNASVRTALMHLPPAAKADLAELETLLHPHLSRARPCAAMVMNKIQAVFMQEFGDQVGNPTRKGRLFDNMPLDEAEYVRADYLFDTQAQKLLRRILAEVEPKASEVQRVP